MRYFLTVDSLYKDPMGNSAVAAMAIVCYNKAEFI